MKKIYLALLIVFGLFAATHASAHGDVTNQNKDVGTYNIEFEYDDKGPVYAEEAYKYGFYLLDKNTKEKVPVDVVSIVFTKKDGTLVVGANLKGNQILESSGTIAATMPEAGDYNAALVFLKGDTELAKADFNFTVAPVDGAASHEQEDSKTEDSGKYTWLIAGVVGLGVGILLGRKNK